MLIGASMLGGSGIFVKISESSPSLIAFYRSLFALPFLYLWMKYQEKDESSNIVWNRRNKFFLILGGLCFALDMSIWNWSLSFTSVANATLMANTAPVFVFGDTLGLAAAVFYAGYIMSVKDLTHALKPARTLFLVTVVTTICLLPISVIETKDLRIGWSEFLILISYAIFSQTIAQGMITSGISKVSAHLSSLVLLMQPVAAAFYGWFLLKEILSPLQLLGGLIVLMAIYMATKKTNPT